MALEATLGDLEGGAGDLDFTLMPALLGDTGAAALGFGFALAAKGEAAAFLPSSFSFLSPSASAAENVLVLTVSTFLGAGAALLTLDLVGTDGLAAGEAAGDFVAAFGLSLAAVDAAGDLGAGDLEALGTDLVVLMSTCGAPPLSSSA